jgi:hypothetical protein
MSRTSRQDLPRIEEHLRRFGVAMMACFTSAVFVLAFVVQGRGSLGADALQQLASLGVALWLVGFLLVFFVAYYRALRRQATAVEQQSAR